LPLALAFGAGNEILQPLAIVVLGGLVSSTFLNLFVVPAGYALAFKVKREATERPGVLARLLRRSPRKSVSTNS
jgi:Cu/Ag efflux pump CusA